MSAPQKPGVLRTVKIAEVVVANDRKRSIKRIEELAASIADVGLIHPIVITKDNKLVAGLHRLRACEALGWTEIPALVLSLSELDAELAEIDENLCRAELTAQERAEQTARRKVIYEVKHPETKAGQSQARASNRAQGRGDVAADSAATSATFTKETASRTGRSERGVRQDVQIAAGIAPDVHDAIRDTPLATRKTELLELARIKDPAEQAKVADLIVSGQAKTVAAAEKKVKAAAKGAPDAIRDQAGHVVTDPALAEVFTGFRLTLGQCVRQARAGLKEVGEAYREKARPSHLRIVRGRDFNDLRHAEEALKRAVDNFSSYAPYSICPLCKGAKGDCLQCTGGGWVTKRSLEQFLQTRHGGRLPKGALRGN